jgi:hypothetical protein
MATFGDNRNEFPFFSYDEITKKIVFNAPVSMINDGSPLPLYVPVIYLNEVTYNLLSGFPNIFEKIVIQDFIIVAASGYYYRLNINNSAFSTNIIPQYSSLSYPLIQTYNYLSIDQAYSTLQSWNPVVSIVFRARNLNVINTMIAQPFVYGFNPNPIVNNAGVSNILFEYFIGRRADPVIEYYPTAEYQLTNLLGITETTELQLDVLWKDTLGNLIPFYLEPNSSLIMKLLFRKKGFNN